MVGADAWRRTPDEQAWSGARVRSVKRGHKTSLFKIMKKRDRNRLSSGVYARALAKDDRMTKKLLGDAAWALGIGIASGEPRHFEHPRRRPLGDRLANPVDHASSSR